ncbi:MAG: ABC transporter permease [Acidobacteria bacterium]|nr:ABC transporter permease [Acidobacteriota bacterium]MBV9478926.1 ABC transporter permease [Acidobacteriota bacterium]
MRSRELRVVLRKDLAELFASRAFWLLLLFTGLIAGQSFISAVELYAEASGIDGGAPALAQGLSPLDGILSPTLGAYDLAIMLLFPFVAIRLVAAEKSSQALKLVLQWPVSLRAQLASKLVALVIAWLLALVAFGVALVLWTSYGGHLDAGETLNLLMGYTLRFLLTMSLAMAAAAAMPGAANAAVVVLAFTIGTWALDFLATGRGGWIETLASYTPASALRTFERGLLRADVVAVLLLLTLALLVLTAIWLHPAKPPRHAIAQTLATLAMTLALCALASRLHASADLAEDRRNSFADADVRALERIDAPLAITLRLAAEDPRMNDFEREVLVKLRRAMRVTVRYPYAGRSGLFDNDPRYGTIEYHLAGRDAVSRSTTPDIVLETIYGLARVPMPPRGEPSYPGYPLAKHARGAAVVFYALWPLSVLLAARGAGRSRRTG